MPANQVNTPSHAALSASSTTDETVAASSTRGRSALHHGAARPGLDARSEATRDAILRASESLFIQQGHDATSLRQITALANVNLAAVNYHFGSKEALVQAVLKRRLAVLNEERLAALDALEAAAGKDAVKPSLIVDAFFGTLMRHAARPNTGAAVLTLLERTMTDPATFVRSLFAEEYAPVLERFRQALFKALPNVPQDEIVWRFQFMLGATSYAIVGPQALRQVTGWDVDAPNADDVTKLLPRLMNFLLGGLRAPIPDFPTESESNRI